MLLLNFVYYEIRDLFRASPSQKLSDCLWINNCTGRWFEQFVSNYNVCLVTDGISVVYLLLDFKIVHIDQKLNVLFCAFSIHLHIPCIEIAAMGASLVHVRPNQFYQYAIKSIIFENMILPHSAVNKILISSKCCAIPKFMDMWIFVGCLMTQKFLEMTRTSFIR